LRPKGCATIEVAVVKERAANEERCKQARPLNGFPPPQPPCLFLSLPFSFWMSPVFHLRVSTESSDRERENAIVEWERGRGEREGERCVWLQEMELHHR
jgi:hypothetical protein